jgi:hypothetical protein
LPKVKCIKAATLVRRRNGSRLDLRDSAGQKLAYVYFEDEPGRRSAAKLLTRDEARRIATNIANRQAARAIAEPVIRSVKLIVQPDAHDVGSYQNL